MQEAREGQDEGGTLECWRPRRGGDCRGHKGINQLSRESRARVLQMVYVLEQRGKSSG